MPSDRAWITGIALVAGLRILALSAVFPFFHPVDEHQHVDLVHRWSRGELPGPQTPTLGEPLVSWAVRFGSFEYLEPDPAPPLGARPGYAEDAPLVRATRRAFENVVNQEAESPPVYYAIAALWYRAGELVFADRTLLLWLRALNALALVLLVVASHAWLRRRRPDEPFLYRGAPAVIALIPQDAFYGVSPDGLCALVGGLAFLAAVDASDPARRSLRRDAGAGLAAGLAFLAKYTNLLYAGVLLLALALRARGRGVREVGRGALLAAAAGAVPVGLWLERNHRVLGDALGTARKVAHLEWTPRPLSALLDHPVLTPAGLQTWISETLAVFWRGEFRWLGEPLTWHWLDAVLWLTTLAVLAAGAASAWAAARRRCWLEPLALTAFSAGLATLAVLSTRFTFADWGNPTRVHPYFTEGRLILGVLLPFAIVFVRGIAFACRGLGPRAAWWALAAWLALLTVTDAWLAAPACASPSNWLHSF